MTDEQPQIIPHLQRPESPQRPSKLAKFDGVDFSGDGEEEEEEEEAGEFAEKSMVPNPRIQRYLVAIEYLGTRFSGAQQQPTGRTVVGVLEDAFQKFIGQPVSIFCSSRTDAGVHALSNVCHVDIERTSKRKPGEVILQLEAEGIPRTLSKKYADIVASTLEESHRNGLNIVKQEDLLCQVKNHRNNIINECHNLRNGLKITSVEMRNAAAAEPTSDETDLEMKKPRPSFEEAAPRAFRRTLGFVSLYVVSFAGLIGVVRTRKNHGV